MAKNQSTKEVKKPRGGKSAGYDEATKPGKVRKGKMVDGEMVWEDDEDELDDDDEPSNDELDELEDDEDEDLDDEDEDEDEEDDAPPPKSKHNVKIEGGKVTKNEVVTNKGKKTPEPEVKLKPSQRPVAPADKRIVAEEKITAKSTVVTVKDLETEYGMDGKKIRRIIRALNYKAPDLETDGGFGAKKKYEWCSKSPHLKKIKAALDEETGD